MATFLIFHVASWEVLVEEGVDGFDVGIARGDCGLCSCLVCSVFEDFSDVFRLHDHFCDSVSLVDNDFRAYALFHVGAEGGVADFFVNAAGVFAVVLEQHIDQTGYECQIKPREVEARWFSGLLGRGIFLVGVIHVYGSVRVGQSMSGYCVSSASSHSFSSS